MPWKTRGGVRRIPRSRQAVANAPRAAPRSGRPARGGRACGRPRGGAAVGGGASRARTAPAASTAPVHYLITEVLAEERDDALPVQLRRGLVVDREVRHRVPVARAGI